MISSVITDILFLSSPCDQMLIKCAFSCVVCRNVLLFAQIIKQCAIINMAVSKTKAKLVDVARQLFAKMGVENTTMNDIALASKKR